MQNNLTYGVQICSKYLIYKFITIAKSKILWIASMHLAYFKRTKKQAISINKQTHCIIGVEQDFLQNVYHKPVVTANPTNKMHQENLIVPRNEQTTL